MALIIAVVFNAPRDGGRHDRPKKVENIFRRKPKTRSCMHVRKPEDLAHQVDDMDPCVFFNPTVIKDTVFGVKNPQQ